MVLQMASISVGMWVKVDCKNSMGLAFEHDGIVADTASNPEQVIVIHYAPAGIAETTLSQFMKMGDNARIVSEITSLSSTVIVDRARSHLGRADCRNCQHFVHWCYHGSAYSRLVFLFGFGFGLAIVLASIFGMTLARKTS